MSQSNYATYNVILTASILLHRSARWKEFRGTVLRVYRNENNNKKKSFEVFTMKFICFQLKSSYIFSENSRMTKI